MAIDVEEIKRKMIKKKRSISAIPAKDFVSTGSAVLNLGCSGRASGGLAKGLIYLFAGDSSSGKTWLAMSVLAEASINPEFDDYDLIFDAAENGAHMKVDRYFGQGLAERIEPLIGTKDDPQPSYILEDFYDNLIARLKKKPAIVILDSMDALKPLAQIRQEQKESKARRDNEKVSGSYHTDKPRINSAKMRDVNNLVAETKSIFVIVCQSRHTIGYESRFNPKTFSGGDALRFYPRLILWTSVGKKIRKKLSDKTVEIIGQDTIVKVTKNHMSGWEGRVSFPFLKRVGIDDLGASIDFLLLHKHWRKGKGGINAKEFEVTLHKERLVRHIEEAELEAKLRKIVAQVWYRVEEEATPHRKNRYER